MHQNDLFCIDTPYMGIALRSAHSGPIHFVIVSPHFAQLILQLQGEFVWLRDCTGQGQFILFQLNLQT